jgi:NodT family efflux transporter outer membrane factor (OMF) lipoprotein
MSADSPADLAKWWQNLNDPLLTGLISDALAANLDLRAAQSRLRQARAQRAVATAARYPDATASGTASRRHPSSEMGGGGSQNTFSVGLDASWELDVFGATRRGIEAADADLASSEASLQNTQESLVAEVALDYVDVRALQARLNIAQNSLVSQSETLQITNWRAQAGLASSQDVEQARSNREQTRAQVPVLETSLAEQEHALDILLGKTPGTLHARLAGVADLPAVPETIAVGIPADTLRQRPDVREAERNLAAETARVGVAEAARYPSFNLSGSIGLESLKLGALGNSGAATSSLLAAITAPIFDAGKRRAQVEIQNAVRERAQIAYEQAVLTALHDVENALVELARNHERVDALSNAVDSAGVAAELARQRYSAGLIDFQSVLETERSVLSTADGLASARASSVQALIRLYKALGGGWSHQAVSNEAGKETPRIPPPVLKPGHLKSCSPPDRTKVPSNAGGGWSRLQLSSSSLGCFCARAAAPRRPTSQPGRSQSVGWL